MHRHRGLLGRAAGLAVVAVLVAGAGPAAADGDPVPLGTTDPDAFAVAVLPDSQGETGAPGQPDHLGEQVDWIVEHADEYGIAMVLHEGDLVGNSADDRQWAAASASLARLDDAGIPYLVAAGNHDVIVYPGDEPGRTRAEWLGPARYDRYLPLSRYQAMPTYGGAMDADGRDVPAGCHERGECPEPGRSGVDSYQVFTAGGLDLLAITVPFAPSRTELEWAAGVVADPRHAGHHVLFLIHDYLGDDDQIRGNRPALLGYGNDSAAAHDDRGVCRWYRQGTPPGCVLEDALATNPGATPVPGMDGRGPTTGIDAWRTVVAGHPNVQFVLSGHVHRHEYLDPATGRPVKGTATGAAVAGTLVSARHTDGGSRVHQMVFNAQAVDGPDADTAGDGAGYFRLLQFEPDADRVLVDTLSAAPGVAPLTGPDNRFALTGVALRQASPTPFWDVPATNPFVAAVHRLRDAGIMTGYADHTFHPASVVTREASAKILFRTLPQVQSGEVTDPGTCTAAGVRSPFTDVDPDHPFCFAIAYLHGNGIVRGYADGLFRSGTAVSRQAFAQWTASVACLRLDRPVGDCTAPRAGETQYFTDVPPTHPFAGAIQYLRAHDVVLGWSDGTSSSFRPAGLIERQAVASYVARMLASAPGA